MRRLRLIAALAALAGGAAASMHPVGLLPFKVIVRVDCSATVLSRMELSHVFLKLKTSWPSGEAVHPVEPAEGSEREQFARLVHEKSLKAIRVYWLQQIFSGRNVPPLERRSDAEIVEYVRNTPGAIGYVSTSALVPGVRVIALDGLSAETQ